MKRIVRLLFPALLASGLAFAHESPIDHVEREYQFQIKDGQLVMSYRLETTDRATLMELKQMDGNGDGKIADAERDAFLAKKADMIAKKFTLEVDNQPLKLSPVGPVVRDRKLGQTYLFSAPLPKLKPGTYSGKLVDGYSREYPGAFRWKALPEPPTGNLRVNPLTPSEKPGSPAHPPWIELNFEVVVP